MSNFEHSRNDNQKETNLITMASLVLIYVFEAKVIRLIAKKSDGSEMQEAEVEY